MEERRERPNEEAIASAGLAGAGAVLVGIGIALAYLLGKRGGGGGTLRRCDPSDDTPTAWLSIAPTGAVTCSDIRFKLRGPNPNVPYFVRWCVMNGTRADKTVTLENFHREEREPVSPLDHRDLNRRPWKVPAGAERQFHVKVAAEAIKELIDSDEDDHEYKYDVWIDRARRLDPEIAIIRR